jgi:hypothetical protein
LAPALIPDANNLINFSGITWLTMKKVKIAALVLAGVFIILQIFQLDKNNSGIGESHIFTVEKLPENISNMLHYSCFDCHSNQTRYPWYDNIAPASWLVAHHIREGKNQLNFSEWGIKDLTDKLGILGEIQEEVKSGAMPLASYTMIHREAKLTKEQVDEMVKWTDKFTEQLLGIEN